MDSSPKTEHFIVQNSTILPSFTSSCSKPVWISCFCWT